MLAGLKISNNLSSTMSFKRVKTIVMCDLVSRLVCPNLSYVLRPNYTIFQ